MKRSTILVGLGTMTCIALAMYATVMNEPEQQYTQSTDGQVQIEGVWRESDDLRIDDVTIAGSSILFEQAYDIRSASTTLDAPVLISFTAPEEGTGLYQYREELGAWSEVMIANDAVITMETADLGLYAFGTAVDIPAVDLTWQYDEILAEHPERTVGARLGTAIMPSGDTELILLDQPDTVACGGRLLPVQHTQQTRTHQQMRVLLNDVETLLDFFLIVEWQIGDGCEEALEFLS